MLYYHLCVLSFSLIYSRFIISFTPRHTITQGVFSIHATSLQHLRLKALHYSHPLTWPHPFDLITTWSHTTSEILYSIAVLVWQILREEERLSLCLHIRWETTKQVNLPHFLVFGSCLLSHGYLHLGSHMESLEVIRNWMWFPPWAYLSHVKNTPNSCAFLYREVEEVIQNTTKIHA